jgi:hypothetical protein
MFDRHRLSPSFFSSFFCGGPFGIGGSFNRLAFAFALAFQGGR